MALSLGWRANAVHESHWIDDEAFLSESIDEATGKRKSLVAQQDKDAWQEDGEASHLSKYATKGNPPTLITWRTLSPEETHVARSNFIDTTSFEGYMRAVLVCFRMGVGFPGVENVKDGEGDPHGYVVREKGIRMLANEFVTHLELKHTGIVAFYGALILNSSFASEMEKKASSPPSIRTPSSEAATTQATTEPSPPEGGATGAQ